MRNRQQGMTAIGLMLILAVLGMIAFGVIQMVPVYLENMKVVQVLNQTKDALDGQNADVGEIRKALSKRVSVEMLYDIKAKKDFVIKRTANGYSVSIDKPGYNLSAGHSTAFCRASIRRFRGRGFF